MADAQNHLLENLKQSQESVLKLVEHIFQISRSYTSARAALPELEGSLLAHFRYQEQKIFPSLEDYFHGERDKLKKIEYLRFGTRELTVALLTLVDKHTNNFSEVAIRNFPKEFLQLRQEIANRVNDEVEHLFPLWEEFLRDRQDNS